MLGLMVRYWSRILSLLSPCVHAFKILKFAFFGNIQRLQNPLGVPDGLKTRNPVPTGADSPNLPIVPSYFCISGKVLRIKDKDMHLCSGGTGRPTNSAPDGF
jgi:hypothetical protein